MGGEKGPLFIRGLLALIEVLSSIVIVFKLATYMDLSNI